MVSIPVKQRKQQHSTIPRAHDEVVVSELMVYPIKSCRGFAVDEWPYTHEGLAFDRQWMIVVEQTHRALTARSHPQMLLIVPTLTATHLHVSIPATLQHSASHHEVLIRVDQDPTTAAAAVFHGDFSIWSSPPHDGWDVGVGSLNEALSIFLGVEVALIMKGTSTRSAGRPGHVDSYALDLDYDVCDERTKSMPNFTIKRDDDEPSSNYYEKQAAVRWTDSFPFLFSTRASESAVDELACNPRNVDQFPKWNADKWSKLGTFDGRRFRSNVIFNDAVAWEEDGWLELTRTTPQDNDNDTFYVVSRCTRCPLPHLDPETAIRDPVVPGNVMKKTRCFGKTLKTQHAVSFGVHAVPKSSNGIIRVGDVFKIIRKCHQDPSTKVWQRPEDNLKTR